MKIMNIHLSRVVSFLIKTSLCISIIKSSKFDKNAPLQKLDVI